MLKELKEGALGARFDAGLSFACLDFYLGDGDTDSFYGALQGYREKNGILNNIYLDTILSDIDLDDKNAVIDLLKSHRGNVKKFIDDPTSKRDLNSLQVAKVVLKHYDKLISKLEVAD